MGKRGKAGVFSALIDPLLLEGGRTVNELTSFLVEGSNGQYDFNKIRNNIRTRIHCFKQRGYVVETTATRRNRKIRLVLPQPVEVQS